MPVAERDVDKRLLTYFDCVVWDGTSRLKILTGQYEPQHSEQEQQQTLETLLACFFPAVRVDVGLVRAIRQLLPADQFDIGHESALWHHPAVNQQHEQWGWQATSRKNYAQAFRALINTLSENKQKKLIQLIADYHALLPEELYFEAMADLLKPETKDLLPAQVQENTERFMADLLKTYQENEQDQGLDGWVTRYLARHDDAVLRQDDEFYIGFLAYAKTRHQQDEEISWPEDIPAEKILNFINQKQSQQGYYLKQKGNKLELLSAELFKQEADDWGNNGIIIATITTRDTQLFYWQTEKNGLPKKRSINLKALDKKVFSFPLAEQYQFQIGKEKITVEASAAMENLPWAFARGMSEEQGSYVETLDNKGNVYRWFWHPPEWKQGAGVLRGVWYLENFKQLTLPSWANNIDRDQYGFYAEFEINGIVSRMRWIEPGQFMMGSPENEAERFDNEVLHEVSLSQGFWLADSVCTQALWKSVMGKNPSHFKSEMNPVENVSWDDINKFLKQINRLKPELALRLPSEAQWEYACRAGTTSPFSFGDNITPEQVNYNANYPYDKAEKGLYREKTVKVKSLPANDWGLFEMHGNVWEWCQDEYAEDLSIIQNDKVGRHRVLRGGGWIGDGRSLRSADRLRYSPGDRDSYIGFRLAGGYDPQPVRQVKSIPAANYASPVAEQG